MGRLAEREFCNATGRWRPFAVLQLMAAGGNAAIAVIRPAASEGRDRRQIATVRLRRPGLCVAAAKLETTTVP